MRYRGALVIEPQVKQVKARTIFRFAAGLICLTITALILLDLEKGRQEWLYDPFNLCALLLVYPIFIWTAVTGYLPQFLSRHLSSTFLREINEPKRYFTRFNAQSVAFALMFLVLFSIALYRSGWA